MKYTKYVINGKFIDTDVLEAMPKILFPLTLATAIVAFVFGATVIPIAVTFDGFRGVKYKMVIFERKHRYTHNFIESRPVQFILIKNPIAQEVQSILRKVA
jgi:hypothetical protein